LSSSTSAEKLRWAAYFLQLQTGLKLLLKQNLYLIICSFH